MCGASRLLLRLRVYIYAVAAQEYNPLAPFHITIAERRILYEKISYNKRSEFKYARSA